MKIYINDQVVDIFSGATVRDAVTRYTTNEKSRQSIETQEIRDHRGHSVSPDGELSEGDRLYIKDCESD